jgi:hypothetical protein
LTLALGLHPLTKGLENGFPILRPLIAEENVSDPSFTALVWAISRSAFSWLISPTTKAGITLCTGSKLIQTQQSPYSVWSCSKAVQCASFFEQSSRTHPVALLQKCRLTIR